MTRLTPKQVEALRWIDGKSFSANPATSVLNRLLAAGLWKWNLDDDFSHRPRALTPAGRFALAEHDRKVKP